MCCCWIVLSNQGCDVQPVWDRFMLPLKDQVCGLTTWSCFAPWCSNSSLFLSFGQHVSGSPHFWQWWPGYSYPCYDNVQIIAMCSTWELPLKRIGNLQPIQNVNYRLLMETDCHELKHSSYDIWSPPLFFGCPIQQQQQQQQNLYNAAATAGIIDCWCLLSCANFYLIAFVTLRHKWLCFHKYTNKWVNRYVLPSCFIKAWSIRKYLRSLKYQLNCCQPRFLLLNGMISAIQNCESP